MIRCKGILVFALIVSLFVGLDASNALAAEKTLKVGVMGPFTGPAARVGEEFQGSVKMAFEKIGYKIGDYKIEVVWIDSQSDPAKATSAYSEAAERAGIQAGILNWHSSVAVATMDVAAQYKVPHFFAMGATSLVNEKHRSDPEKYGYWHAKLWPIPSKLILGYVESLNNAVTIGHWKPDKKLVALWAEDTDWGRDVGAGFKKMFTETGWEISSEDYFSLTQTDFYPLMSKWKKAGVAIAAGTSTATASVTAFIKQASEVGVKAMIVADGLGWIGDWYKLTGPSSDTVLDMIPQLTTPEARAWAEATEKRFGYKPSASSGGLCYEGANFFIKIARRTLEKYGKIDKETLHKVGVEEVDTGKLTYSKADGAMIMNEYRYSSETIPDPVVATDAYYFPVIQYKGGKGYIVFPEGWKDADMNFK